MQINITARDFGGTEFLAQPHRLHLGAQKAEGVDRREFSLPEQWNGCVVTLHIRHTDNAVRKIRQRLLDLSEILHIAVKQISAQLIHLPVAEKYASRNRLRQRGPEFYRLGQR